MANKYASLDALFTGIADTIRAKTGDADLIPAKQFPSVIRNQLDKIPPLVNFTIDGVVYQAPEGMKWGDWCVSDYNTGGFEIQSAGKIGQPDLKTQIDGVVADDVIVHGIYDLAEISIIAFTIRDYYGNINNYEAYNGMSWSQWCGSSYNPGNYAVDSGIVMNTYEYTAIFHNDMPVAPTDSIIARCEYYEMSW